MNRTLRDTGAAAALTVENRGGVMGELRRLLLRNTPAAAVCAVTLTASGLAPASAANAPAHSRGAVSVAQGGPVSPLPAKGTPYLTNTGTTEQVRQLVQCGGTMYAVGTFTEISWNGQTFPRNNAFSFSATFPFSITSWDPDVNGTVNSIALSSDCSDAYIGGQFSSVGATPAKNIAEIDTTSGAVVPGFRSNAGGQVETLLGVNGHILAGGEFKSINGTGADPYMVSLNPATGADDGFVHLGISGHYSYPGVSSNPTKVYNQQLSHGGTLELVEGDFTSVGGMARQQIFMLDLSGTKAKVTGWSSPEWDGSAGNVPEGYPYQCSESEPYYIKAAAWSPDDSTVYIVSNGYHPWNLLVGSYPRSGLCDAIAAFPATPQAEVLHTWINYTGCDSLYSVAADTSAVYAGGHERWGDNNAGCNFPGTGAIPAPGMGGFEVPDGLLLLNSAGTSGLYTRARGLGADDMLLTSAGLWVASDNWKAVTCGGVGHLAGICFLPYS
jgi:hypothetical protein